MLSRKYRLTLSTFPFNKVPQARTSLFSVRHRPNSLGHIRAAAIVGSSVHSSSAKRHLVKRRLLSIIGSYLFLSQDIVVVAFSQAATASYKDLKKAFDNIASKLH